MITLMEAKIENCTIFACNVTAWIKCLGSYIFRCGTLAFIGFEDFFNSNAIPLRGGCEGSLAQDLDIALPTLYTPHSPMNDRHMLSPSSVVVLCVRELMRKKVRIF